MRSKVISSIVIALIHLTLWGLLCKGVDSVVRPSIMWYGSLSIFVMACATGSCLYYLAYRAIRWVCK